MMRVVGALAALTAALAMPAAASSWPCSTSTAPAAWSAGTPVGLSIRVQQGGACFVIAVDGTPWLVSGGAELVVDGKLRSSRAKADEDALRVVSATTGGGLDAAGPYSSYSIEWSAPGSTPPISWTTSIAMYDGGQTLAFTQSFGTAVKGFNATADLTAGAWGRPGSGFPTFLSGGPNSAKLGGEAGLGYVSYGEIGIPRTGRFPGVLGTKTRYKNITKIEFDGVPLTFLDESGVAAILSPSKGFYDTAYDFVPAAAEGGHAAGGGRVDAGDDAEEEGILRCGLPGTFLEAPAGMELQSWLHVGPRASRDGGGGASGKGVTETIMSWGDLMMAKYGKKSRTAPDATAQVEKLGATTTGHYFYGVEVGKTAEATVLDVAEAAAKAGLKFGYFLIDSWWYKQNGVPKIEGGGSLPGYGGVHRWDDSVARDWAFPKGLKALREALGVPFVMHMGEWTGTVQQFGPPPYAKNASWDWVVEEEASIPRPGSKGAALFWEWLFSSMAANGLDTYKLDHSQSQQPNMEYLLTTPGSTETWLREMAAAAARHNVSKMYGGHISSGFLHSLLLPNAHTARASDDYIPLINRAAGACGGVDAQSTSPHGNVLMGSNSLYPWAVGLRPYKDGLLSGTQRWSNTTCFQIGESGHGHYSFTDPEWWGLQEEYPELHALVAALSAGPVALADGVGDIDIDLAKRTCRADGVLLKPDRPAFVVDAWWAQKAFGTGGPDGEVTHTSTTLGTAGGEALRWDFVLGAALVSAYTVTAEQLVPGSPAAAPAVAANGVAWRRRYGEAWAAPLAEDLIRFDASAPLSLPLPAAKNDTRWRWGEYTLWRTAPLTCGGKGWALLGEPSKLISVSPQRIKAVAADCDGPSITVDVYGEAAEVVTLAFLSPTGVVHTSSLALGAHGETSVTMGPQQGAGGEGGEGVE